MQSIQNTLKDFVGKEKPQIPQQVLAIDDMISKLSLTYNKLRQEKITTELIEIVSGAEALK